MTAEMRANICPISREPKCRPCDPALCNVGTEKGTRWEIANLPVSKETASVSNQPLEDIIGENHKIRPIMGRISIVAGGNVPWAGYMQDGLW